LTTAEELLLETLVARVMTGATSWAFPHRLWIKPWVDRLAHEGLITWCFNDDGDFELTPTKALATYFPEVATVHETILTVVE